MISRYYKNWQFLPYEKRWTMEQILQSLKQYNLISNQEVTSIRQSLHCQYPHYSSMQRAQLFAQDIHRRLDFILEPFTEEIRKQIKFFLLRQTLYKSDFSINIYDVLKSFTHLECDIENSLDLLKQWLSHHKANTLTHEELVSLLDLLRNGNVTTIPQPLLETATALPKQSPIFTLHKLTSYMKTSKPVFIILCLSIGCFMSISYATLYKLTTPHNYLAAFEAIKKPEITCPITLSFKAHTNYLQKDLQYTNIDTTALKDWLLAKDSLLAQEPYFSCILDAAKEFNVNPLLLFAITGQEQSFVPKSHKQADEIANNPFNIYGSWEDYNTSIKESARIAAQTITNLGKGCPHNEDQIKWINKSYAEDPNWHLGVSYFFNTLKETAMLPSES